MIRRESGKLDGFRNYRLEYSARRGRDVMSCQVKFSTAPPGGDRVHYVTEEDIRIVLSRLPADLWRSLRTVHLNDRSLGPRRLGYVNRGRRDISICALPPRMSLTRALRKGLTPEQFGATRGGRWPSLAIRRFMLYNVFLHELGHLQLVDKKAPSIRLKFARERLAQEFAMHWCGELWKEPFAHPDLVHNPPTPGELDQLVSGTPKSAAEVAKRRATR